MSNKILEIPYLDMFGNEILPGHLILSTESTIFSTYFKLSIFTGFFEYNSTKFGAYVSLSKGAERKSGHIWIWDSNINKKSSGYYFPIQVIKNPFYYIENDFFLNSYNVFREYFSEKENLFSEPKFFLPKDYIYGKPFEEIQVIKILNQ